MRFSALTALFVFGSLACAACASNNKDPDPVPDTGNDAGPPSCPNEKAKLASPPTCSQSPNTGNPCTFEASKKIQYICNIGSCPSDGCKQSNFFDPNPTYTYWCCDK